MKRIASLLLTIILCCTAVLPAYAAQQLTQEPELYFVNVLSLVNEESEDAAPFFTVTVYRFPEAGDVLLAEEETLYEMIGDSVYYEGGIDTEAPFEYQGAEGSITGRLERADREAAAGYAGQPFLLQ